MINMCLFNAQMTYMGVDMECSSSPSQELVAASQWFSLFLCHKNRVFKPRKQELLNLKEMNN